MQLIVPLLLIFPFANQGQSLHCANPDHDNYHSKRHNALLLKKYINTISWGFYVGVYTFVEIVYGEWKWE